MNSTAVTAATDMGGDGTLSGRKMAADVYGFALHYNSTDYKAINLSKTVVAPVTSTALPAFKDLYNGNIAAMAVTFNHTSFGSAGSGLNQSLLYKYRYDQLNRIKEMDAYSGLNQSTNAWAFGSALTAYQERVSYDGNGNILTYTRNGDAARTAMDNMTYSYVSGTNKLDKVVDLAADASPANYPNYNDLKTGQATGNYGYDAIGNLIKDVSEGISSGGIVWNVYGKIESVTKNGVTTSYTYDASGNRISKTTSGKTTWYVRDASGNVMAVYENGNSLVNSGHLTQIEVHLYGSSRLGMWTPNRDVQVITSAQTTAMTGITNGGTTTLYRRGQKLFELSNHLGNVLVTITDRKVAIQNGSTGTILNYVADVVSGSDYYPFGMLMPGRKYDAQSGYRYGFNGKEKDKDINSLTAYDYGFRIYNPVIGKFLSLDPLINSYPWYTPYQFAGNTPIVAIDLDGLEEYVVTNYYDKENKLTETKISIVTDRKNGKRVNQMLQKQDGSYIATMNVLVRNVSFDGTTSYSHQLVLNKQQKDIVNKAKAVALKLDEEGSSIYYGDHPDKSEIDDDKGEFIETENDKYKASTHRVNSYSSKNIQIVKAVPIIKPVKKDAIKLPISKEPIHIESKIKFESYSKHFSDGPDNNVMSEVSKILSLVNQTGVKDYSIKILGNVATLGKGWDSDEYLPTFSTHKNYGSLALKRANAIKEKLVEAGLDPSKITTELGSRDKASSADYFITLQQ